MFKNELIVHCFNRDEKKPNPLIVKPPNAVPFSDEWLAAIEAAGEV